MVNQVFTFLAKLFNLRSKWLMILLIGLIIVFVGVLGYLKFYNIDYHHDQIDQMYNENKSLKSQLLKLENGYKLLNNSISTLQTQMTYGVILDSAPKGKLQIKQSSELESELSSRITDASNINQKNLTQQSSNNQIQTEKKNKKVIQPMDEQLSKMEIENEEQFNAKLDAQIDDEIEMMLNEGNTVNQNPNKVINQKLTNPKSINQKSDKISNQSKINPIPTYQKNHQYNDDEEQQDDNQVIVIEDNEESDENETQKNAKQVKQIKQNIIRANDFDINSSVLDLGNFRQEIMKDNLQLQNQILNNNQIEDEIEDDMEDEISNLSQSIESLITDIEKETEPINQKLKQVIDHNYQIQKLKNNLAHDDVEKKNNQLIVTPLDDENLQMLDHLDEELKALKEENTNFNQLRQTKNYQQKQQKYQEQMTTIEKLFERPRQKEKITINLKSKN